MWWALAAMAVSSALSASGAASSASANKADLKHKARMAEINAGLSQQKAEGAFIQGRSQIASAMRQHGQAIARQRASMASRGIDIGYGSAAEVRATSEFFKEVDYNTLSANALRNAWGYRSEATDFENQAMMAKANADAISPKAAAWSSLLSSAATSALMYGALGGFSKTAGTEASLLGENAFSNWMAEGGKGLGNASGFGTTGFTGTGSVGFKASADSFMKMPNFNMPLSASLMTF